MMLYKSKLDTNAMCIIPPLKKQADQQEIPKIKIEMQKQQLEHTSSSW